MTVCIYIYIYLFIYFSVFNTTGMSHLKISNNNLNKAIMYSKQPFNLPAYCV